jgi:hypothetical protein
MHLLLGFVIIITIIIIEIDLHHLMYTKIILGFELNLDRRVLLISSSMSKSDHHHYHLVAKFHSTINSVIV